MHRLVYPTILHSVCTTNALGDAADSFCRRDTTRRGPNASNAPTVACSFHQTNSFSIRIGSDRAINTSSRTQQISIRGVGTWNWAACRRMRSFMRGKMSKQCSTVAHGSVWWARYRHRRLRRAFPHRIRVERLRLKSSAVSRAECNPSRKPTLGNRRNEQRKRQQTLRQRNDLRSVRQ